MACFTLGWIFQLLIWIVIVGAIVAILKLLIPWVLSQFNLAGGMIAQVLNIIIMAAVVIMVIYLVWGLVSCLTGSGLSLLPPHPGGR